LRRFVAIVNRRLSGSGAFANGSRGWCQKLPLLRHPVKRGMALERTDIGREQPEADRAAAVVVVDAVDACRNPTGWL
jgi:hypothetical protein